MSGVGGTGWMGWAGGVEREDLRSEEMVGIGHVVAGLKQPVVITRAAIHVSECFIDSCPDSFEDVLSVTRRRRFS